MDLGVMMMIMMVVVEVEVEYCLQRKDDRPLVLLLSGLAVWLFDSGIDFRRCCDYDPASPKMTALSQMRSSRPCS
jgi:hypothetical protein